MSRAGIFLRAIAAPWRGRTRLTGENGGTLRSHRVLADRRLSARRLRGCGDLEDGRLGRHWAIVDLASLVKRTRDTTAEAARLPCLALAARQSRDRFRR